MNKEEFIEWLRETLEININVDWSIAIAEDEFKVILHALNEAFPKTTNKENK